MFSAKRKAAPTPEVAVAVLEPTPEPEPEPQVPVMERAIAAIQPFEIKDDYFEVGDQLATLTRKKNSLFGIEHEAVVEINKEIAAVSTLYQKTASFRKFPGEKRRLDLEVLTWRKFPALWHNGIATPLPSLALFSLDTNRLSLQVNSWGGAVFNPSLPSFIGNQYSDVTEALSAITKADRWRTLALHAAFTGVIPDETREKIFEAKQTKAFSDIRLLAETEWVLESYPNPVFADPIVVGIVGDEMWVIDVFDPTPLEEYVAQEFTA